ncbi:hypothetical protein ACFL6G_07995 [candidate division KSB1 bacterium]
MKKIITIIFLVSISCIFIFSAIKQGQNLPKPLIYLGEYKVKPDKIDQFESNMKDWISQMKRYNMPYSFHMFSTDNFVYYSVNDFDNFSMFDQFDADWGKVVEKVGQETIDRYHEEEFGAINSFKAMFLRFRKGHSYLPETFRFSENEINFLHMTFYYLHQEYRQEWASLQRQWVELYQNNNIEMPFMTLTGGTGYEMPVWIYIGAGKDRTDYFAEKARTDNILGEAGDNLLKQNLPMIKRLEEIYCRYRPDLSYIPEK